MVKYMYKDANGVIDINKSYIKKPNQYEILPEIVEYLIKKLDPRMIILFGSCARGVITVHSDIDLCIVVEEKLDVKERVKIRSELLMDLIDISDFEVYLFICGIEDWEKKHKDQGTFIGKIYKEGKTIYGR